MAWFRNFYECPRDGTRWADEWSCTCDDRCPTCNASITPYESVDLEGDRFAAGTEPDLPSVLGPSETRTAP